MALQFHAFFIEYKLKVFFGAGETERENKMEEKLKSRFLGLYHMVISDGIVESKELETLYRIGQENYHLSPEDITKYISSVGTSYSVNDNIEIQIGILYEMAEIAWADGVIDDSEKRLLSRYAVRFGFAKENADAITDFMLEQVKNCVSKKDVINLIITE